MHTQLVSQKHGIRVRTLIDYKMVSTVPKTLTFYIFVFFQIKSALLLDIFCTETWDTIEDVLPNVWSNLAWGNVQLEELNLQDSTDFHKNLMSIATRKDINLGISFLGNGKHYANDDRKVTLISRCELDFYGFEQFVRMRKPLTTMIVVSRTFLADNILNYMKKIKIPTSFYFLDVERQVCLNFCYPKQNLNSSVQRQ